MKDLIQVLTVHSLKELLRYKSFLFLIFFLIFADRMIRQFVNEPETHFAWPDGYVIGKQTSHFVFTELPDKLLHWLFTPGVIAIVVGLFILKQAISLWPSSDMRRMHRKERGRFGVMEALVALRWFQVAWDGMAVGLVCIVTAAWVGLAYISGWWIWSLTGSVAGLYVTGGLAVLVLPLAMAGFSYSSKLAVIRHGTFGSRFRLFLELFTNLRLLIISWIFFLGRMLVEALFVAIIPLSAILLIDSFWLRMTVAALSATPAYAYLKMASFKFFLEVYRPYPLVKLEYAEYYATLI